MATIELYAGKTNLMFDKFDSMRSSVNDFKMASESFQKHLNMFDSNIYNTYVIQGDIQTSIDTQQTELDSMDSLIAQTEEFIDLVLSTDESVAEAINQSKNDFYEEYSYLKPYEEKSGWEKFCDGLKKVGEWCKDHWKLIVTIILVIAAVVVIVLSGGTALGALAPFLILAAKGVLIGAAVGGLVGGLISKKTGGGFFEGFEDGAFGGAVSGLLTAGLGSWIGGSVGAELSAGKAMLVTALSEMGSSLVGDVGDVFIKRDKKSLETIILNAGFSFALGGIFSGISSLTGKWMKIKIIGINKGTDSWKFVWCRSCARFLSNGERISTKAVLKGFGADIIDGAWDDALEIAKGRLGKIADLWN